MSLRYRLFLWILVTFLVAFLFDYILENYTTSKKLTEAQGQLKEKILEVSEEKRQHIERFLASMISENQARVDVLLHRMTNYYSQVAPYAPTDANLVRGTWAPAATLLAKNKWLDFVQNTNEGKLASVIIPRPSSLDGSYRIPIDAELSWVVMSDELQRKKPLMGILLPIEYQPELSQAEGEQILLPRENIFEGEVLFEIEDLLHPSAAGLNGVDKEQILIVPWVEGYQINMGRFCKAFDRARAYLQQGLSTLSSTQDEQMHQWVEAQLSLQGKKLSDVDLLVPPADYKVSSQWMEERLDVMLVHYRQVYMIWTIAAFFQTGLFGNDLFSAPAPRGLSVYQHGDPHGTGVHTADVFYPQAVFEDQQYFQTHHSSDSISNLGDSVAVFHDPEHHVYLGNTAQILVRDKDQDKVGYLSVAVDGDIVLQKLVETVGQTALIVHGGEIFGAYSEEGEEIPVKSTRSLPIPQILTQKTGIVAWDRENYFFSHMVPFPGIDLHFVILNPVAREFAFTKFLVESAVRVVDSILLNVHIIGFSMMILVLILLHNIARRITRPITQLALATKEIGAGRFDEANIPHPPSTGHGDEVAILCDSFEQMVKGLKEKEKVKGVLNKVVSQEIAQEILKGSIHLGGEEKRVTVLFADIRNFTNMTQNMKPKEVIDFLNTCMTKISYIIDKNDGVIDKYVGDATMALFGAPVSHENSALQAIKSALGIVAEIHTWNQERAQQGSPPLEMGIGIHTGNVLAGNMGAENRLNYTVIGRNVNLASRLCSSAQGMEIRISLDTLNEPKVREQIIVEDLGPTVLKGFDQPIEVFRVKGLK